MKAHITNFEGIVLRAEKGREGGRSLFIFTKEQGLLRCTVPRAVLQRYGTGCVLSWAKIRFTVQVTSAYAIMRQYEGALLLDMMKMSYADMQPWYYVLELALQLFPLHQEDYGAYRILEEAALAARQRNPKIAACIAAVQLLAQAGFDPASEEMMDSLELDVMARPLLLAFRRYVWGRPLGMPISLAAFEGVAAYLDRLIPACCDVEMHTKGAFISVK